MRRSYLGIIWREQRGLAIVALCYLVVFGTQIIASRGIPYAIDNNESFSTLWHARNLYNTPFALTYGLTDEVAAWHPQASPYVHSHQGNWPRIFGFLLYCLGARTIESQIAVTTFSIGILSIILAYRFLERIGSRSLALTVCLFLITDYPLFSQWQTNTYRVWYGFFFFSSLLWIEDLSGNRRWKYLILGVLNFAALFYGEYVYASFVAIMALCYAWLKHRRTRRLAITASLVVGVGIGLSVAILSMQLLAYMGLANLTLDIGYTLKARNMSRDFDFAEKATRFYAEHHIIFLQNYFDISALRNWEALLQTITKQQFQFSGPTFALTIFIILVGALCLLFTKSDMPQSRRRGAIMGISKMAILIISATCLLETLGYQLSLYPVNRISATRVDPSAVLLTWDAVHNATYEINIQDPGMDFRAEGQSTIPSFVATNLSRYAMYHFEVRSVLGAGVTSPYRVIAAPLVVGDCNTTSGWLSPFATVALGVLAIIGLSRAYSGTWLGFRFVGWGRLMAASGVLLFAAYAISHRIEWFDSSIAYEWNQAFGSFIPDRAKLAFLGLAAFGTCAICLANLQVMQTYSRTSGNILVITLCVFVAYATVYRIFTGYVFSGYLVRQAPFLVFWSDTLIGFAFFFLLQSARQLYQQRQTGPTPWHQAEHDSKLKIFAYIPGPQISKALRYFPMAFAGFLLVVLAGAWVYIQIDFVRIIPPVQYSFLSLISKPPYRGHSFVVNNYAAPIANQTRSWAYAESSIFSGQVALGPDGFTVDHDRTYLWFADGITNKAYDQPDYGLLVQQPSSIGSALHSMNESKSNRSVSPDSGILERASDLLQPFVVDKIVERESSHYSIVQFDWDFPPFLQPIDRGLKRESKSMTFQQKIAISEFSQAQGRNWRVEISSPFATDSSSAIRLAHALIDKRSIFSDEEFLAAGWKRIEGQDGEISDEWTSSTDRMLTLSKVVTGDRLDIAFRCTDQPSEVRLSVNEICRTLELRGDLEQEKEITLSSIQPHGKHTLIPIFTPGVYVSTELRGTDQSLQATARYRFYQQSDGIEDFTSIRLYHESADRIRQVVASRIYLARLGVLVDEDELVNKNPRLLSEYRRVVRLGDKRTFLQWLSDDLESNRTEKSRSGIYPAPQSSVKSGESELSLPFNTELGGLFQLSITPSTRSKNGPEYFGLPFSASGFSSMSSPFSEPANVVIPSGSSSHAFVYGTLKLRLRFPSDQTKQAEPIVSSGIDEAGDFVYVIYVDDSHIQLGFDHWFKGGKLTGPISIDYSEPHDLEISMGSLFPPEGDIVYAELPPSKVEALKSTVVVKLDGKTIIDSPSTFYDTPPESVTVGQNLIKGTTSNVRFTGRIISQARTWPFSN
jgi:hypothetical protein